MVVGCINANHTSTLCINLALMMQDKKRIQMQLLGEQEKRKLVFSVSQLIFCLLDSSLFALFFSLFPHPLFVTDKKQAGARMGGTLSFLLPSCFFL